jgi:thiosulfate reductase cytochrome b subunit
MKPIALRLMLFALAYAPLQAIGQEVQVPIAPPAYYGSGPWHMWTYGSAWHFWLMIPMMIFFLLLLCTVMIIFVRGAFGHWGSQFYGRQPKSRRQSRPFANGHIGSPSAFPSF